MGDAGNGLTLEVPARTTPPGTVRNRLGEIVSYRHLNEPILGLS